MKQRIQSANKISDQTLTKVQPTKIPDLDRNEIKRGKHSSTHEMKNSGFPLIFNMITPNPRRSPPSLPLLIQTKIGSLLI
jgi:hypothetical protein